MKKIISVLITLIVIVTFILLLVSPKEEFSYNENRYLAKFPRFDISNILSGKFMTKLDTYISDNFPCRENLLGFKTRLYMVVIIDYIKNIRSLIIVIPL